MKLTADLSPTPFLLYRTADNHCLVTFTLRRVQAVLSVYPLQTLVCKKAIASKRKLNQGLVNYRFRIGYGSFNTTKDVMLSNEDAHGKKECWYLRQTTF